MVLDASFLAFTFGFNTLSNSFPNGTQNGTTIFVVTSGMYYQNSGGYTTSPFSERLDAFLTWADITYSKISKFILLYLCYIYFLFSRFIGVTDGTLVTVGQACVEVGRTISAPILTLFTELQRFFLKHAHLWDGKNEN